MNLSNNKRISNTKNKEKMLNLANGFKNQGKRWTDDEISILIKGCSTGENITYFQDKIKRTNNAITSKASKLGFNFVNWNNHMLKILIKGVLETKKLKNIADELNLDEIIVENKAKKLNLIKIVER